MRETWKPRPMIREWTPDQARLAAHLPASKRLEVTASNGVGKTFWAADLVVSFLEDFKAARVVTTAPTKRQVETLLWPEIWKRLSKLGRTNGRHSKSEYQGEDGDYALGFATNNPDRAQGPHNPHLLVVVDEASGVSSAIQEALEGIAVGQNDYIVEIGNPTDPASYFATMHDNPTWTHEHIDALTHPNILERREVIAGAVSVQAIEHAIKNWCRQSQVQTENTFEYQGNLYLPNDAFNTRFLGRYPLQAAKALFNKTQLQDATKRDAGSAKIARGALDIARTGGDRTAYASRAGNAVSALEIIPPASLPEQARYIVPILVRDGIKSLTCDGAGLGIGLIDELRELVDGNLDCEIRIFLGSDKPTSQSEAKRYLNKRAMAYGHLAMASSSGNLSLPAEPELLAELLLITVHHRAQQMICDSKDDLKARGHRSPDLADVVSMLFEQPADTDFHAFVSNLTQTTLEEW